MSRCRDTPAAATNACRCCRPHWSAGRVPLCQAATPQKRRAPRCASQSEPATGAADSAQSGVQRSKGVGVDYDAQQRGRRAHEWSLDIEGEEGDVARDEGREDWRDGPLDEERNLVADDIGRCGRIRRASTWPPFAALAGCLRRGRRHLRVPPRTACLRKAPMQWPGSAPRSIYASPCSRLCQGRSMRAWTGALSGRHGRPIPRIVQDLIRHA